jgi:hypothetical protein
MPNHYSSSQLTFRIFDDELALHVDPYNTAERFSPTPFMTGQNGNNGGSLISVKTSTHPIGFLVDSGK